MLLWLIIGMLSIWGMLFLFTRYIKFAFLKKFVILNFIVSLILTVFCFFEIGYLNELVYLPIFNWINIGIMKINIILLYDTLTIVMVFIVLFISCLVHLYSFSYMRSDPNFFRFISYLSLFTFFMLVLVTSNNFLQLLIGWEGVGLSSYLLICFWYTRIAANLAAIKAMSVNRIGDIFLLFTIFLVFSFFGSVNFGVVFNNVIYLLEFYFDLFFIEIRFIDLLCFFIFLAACGKSAQLLLHIWLPDAMEGPTPVSALIHAATMVTAGVFLVIRCSILFEHSSKILFFMVFIGSFTCFFMSILGAFQQDIKKIVAYSTCSQLGYMFMGCGLSSYNTSFFHLFNHAFFKALLFLSMGVIIHALSDEQDLRKMGNLVNFLPYTIVIVFFGNFALLGLPFLAGFYSKDILIEVAFARFYLDGSFAYFLGLFAAFFTSFYSTRLFLRIFFNYSNFNRYTIVKLHEVDILMFIPLIILLLCSFFVGFFFFDMFIGIGSFFFFDSIFINFINYSGIYMEFENLINVLFLKLEFLYFDSREENLILNLFPDDGDNNNFIARLLWRIWVYLNWIWSYINYYLSLAFMYVGDFYLKIRWLTFRYLAPCSFTEVPFSYESMDYLEIFVYFEDLAKIVHFDVEAFDIFLTTAKFGVMEDNIFKETISLDEMKSYLIESNYDINKCLELINQNPVKLIIKINVKKCELVIHFNQLFMLFPASKYINEENTTFFLKMWDISFFMNYKDLNLGGPVQRFGTIGTNEILHTLVMKFGDFDENSNFIKKKLYSDFIKPVIERTSNQSEYLAEVVKIPIFVEIEAITLACIFKSKMSGVLFYCECQPMAVYAEGPVWYKNLSEILSYVSIVLTVIDYVKPEKLTAFFYDLYNFLLWLYYVIKVVVTIIKVSIIGLMTLFIEKGPIFLDSLYFDGIVPLFENYIIPFCKGFITYCKRLTIIIHDILVPFEDVDRHAADPYRQDVVQNKALIKFINDSLESLENWYRQDEVQNNALIKIVADIIEKLKKMLPLFPIESDNIDISMFYIQLFIRILPLIISIKGFFTFYFLDDRFILYYYNVFYRKIVLRFYNGLFFDKLFIDVFVSKFYFFCYYSFYKNIESSFFQKYNIYIFDKNRFSFYFFFKLFSNGSFFVYILIVLCFIFFYFFIFFIFKIFNILFNSLILILFISSFVFKWLILKDSIKKFLKKFKK